MPQSSIRRAVAGFAIAPLLALTACGGDSAGPQTPVAASIQAVSTTTQTGVVGSAAAAVPTVKVVSSSGVAVPGTVVTFAVSGGGTLGAASATTGADGTASAKSWTLGTVAGANTVTASAAGLTAVTFTATAAAGPAATISAISGDNQSAAIGTAVATAPSVVVRDQYGNAVSGAGVTFAVAAGGGTLTGASATTGTDGVARVGGWTLGIAAGAQRLTATTGTLSATITATGTIPTGCNVINYALGATLPLTWEANDCTKTSGHHFDQLQFTTTQQEQVDAAVTGPNGRLLFLRRESDSLFVGLQPGTAFSPATQNPMHMKYILAPGKYTFQPTAPDAATLGSYTFTTTTNTAIDCNYIIFASTNVTFSGVVDNTSCLGPVGDREQWINLQLKTGMKVRITLSGTDEVPFLIFRDDRLGPASPTLATARGTTRGETVSVTWTATFDTWHEIVITSANANLLGKYTLKIEQLP